MNYLLEIISNVFFFLSGYLWFLIAKNNCFFSAFWVGCIGMFSCQLFVKLVPYAQESPDTIIFFWNFIPLFFKDLKKKIGFFQFLVIIQFVQPQLIIFSSTSILIYSIFQSIRPVHFFIDF